MFDSSLKPWRPPIRKIMVTTARGNNSLAEKGHSNDNVSNSNGNNNDNRNNSNPNFQIKQLPISFVGLITFCRSSCFRFALSVCLFVCFVALFFVPIGRKTNKGLQFLVISQMEKTQNVVHCFRPKFLLSQQLVSSSLCFLCVPPILSQYVNS